MRHVEDRNRDLSYGISRRSSELVCGKAQFVVREVCGSCRVNDPVVCSGGIFRRGTTPFRFEFSHGVAMWGSDPCLGLG